MNWTMDQVITFNKSVRVASRKVAIHNETALLDYYQWNLSDLLIYQYFKIKLQQKITSNSTYYEQEINDLHSRREELYNTCVERLVIANLTTASGSKVSNYEYRLKPSRPETCLYYTAGTRKMWEMYNNRGKAWWESNNLTWKSADNLVIG